MQFFLGYGETVVCAKCGGNIIFRVVHSDAVKWLECEACDEKSERFPIGEKFSLNLNSPTGGG